MYSDDDDAQRAALLARQYDVSSQVQAGGRVRFSVVRQVVRGHDDGQFSQFRFRRGFGQLWRFSSVGVSRVCSVRFRRPDRFVFWRLRRLARQSVTVGWS